MKNIALTLIIIVSTLFSADIFAQTITGGVFSENNSPVIFANVVLLTPDSVFVNGTITDENGHFSLNTDPKASIVSISCIGYETKTLNISDNLSKIILRESNTQLGEVTISADLPKTRIKDGAMVTDVQNTLLSNSLTATQMLTKLPGVTSTKDGIEVFGKGTPEIYINNVKVRDDSELKQLDPKNVKTIEVINNPGAEYDAEVQAVIKIYTLKPLDNGLSFEYTSVMSYYENADFLNRANINIRKQNLDIFAGATHCDSHNFLQSNVHNYLNSNAIWEYTQRERVEYNSGTYIFTGGMNYQFDQNNFAGFKFKIGSDYKDKDEGNGDLTAYKDGSAIDQISEKHDTHLDKAAMQTVNAYYNGKIGGMSVDFNADLYAHSVDKKSNNYENANVQDNRTIGSTDLIDSKMIAEKLVLSDNVFGGKLSFGGENIVSDYSDNFKSLAEEYVPTVESRSKQVTTAAFVQYSHKIADKWSAKAGLRYENVDFKYFNGGVLDNETSRKYDNFFPSASLSFSPGNFEMDLSYAQKTKRPSYFMMRNSFMYGNRYFIEAGNSALQPREISEFAYILSWKCLQLNASYRNVKNLIMYWGVVDNNNPEVLINRPKNYDKNVKGFILNLSASPEFGCYTPQIDLSLTKQKFDIEIQGVTHHLNKPAFTAEIDNYFEFGKGWCFDLDFNFVSKGHREDNYYQSNYYVIDMYVSKSFFGGALNVEAGVADLTKSHCRDIKVLSSQGYMEINDTYDTKEFYIQFQYRFNPAKSKYKGTGAGNDEKERM